MFVGEGYVAMSSIFFKVNFDHMDIEHLVADSSKNWKHLKTTRLNGC